MEPTSTTTEAQIEITPPREGLEAGLALIARLEGDATPEPVEADPGDEQPEGDELPSEGEPQAEGGDSSPEPDVAEEVEEEPDELEGVYETLQIDGWRLSELKGLSKAALIRMGKAAAKRQSDVTSKFASHSAEIGTLKQQLDAKGKSEAEPGTESPGQPARANLAEIAERFSKVSGIEAREAEPILNELGALYTAPLRSELGVAQATIQQMSAALGEMMFGSVREELKETYPKLATPEGVAAVKKHSKRLNPEAYADLGYRDRIKAMVQDAYGLAYKTEAAPDKKPKHAPKKGQPSLPGRQPVTKGLNPLTAGLAEIERLEKKHRYVSR